MIALFWRHGLHLGHCFHLLWRRVWNRKGWCRYLSHGCLETRPYRQEYALVWLIFQSSTDESLDIIPVIMAGIIGIYGLVVSVLISNDLQQKTPLYTGFIQLGAGLSVGLAGLAAGFAIGIVGDAGVRGTAQQPRLFVGMILILIFAEVLGKFQLLLFGLPSLMIRKGLYGLIVALLMNSRSKGEPCP